MIPTGTRFQDRLFTLCRLHPKRLAFPESSDGRVLAAAQQLLKEGVAREITLFGDPQQILQLAKQQGLALARYEKQLVWASAQHSLLPQATRQHVEESLQRRGKSVTQSDLEVICQQPLDQAAFLLASRQVEAVVAGCVHTTADVIRAALRGVGLARGSKTISGSFAMVREPSDAPPLHYMFGDCGVVVDPDPEQLIDFAQATVATFRALFPDEVPQVAFLSFSTKGSAQHPMAEKMQKAATLFRERHPDILADGELQFDAAYDRMIAQRKAPGSPVAGRANCFIFPNLDAGNIAYKICQRLAGFDAYGPILQGTAKPYTDLSRGASVYDIVISSLIAMMRANSNDAGNLPA